MTQLNETPVQGGLVLVGGKLCLDFCNTVEAHDFENRIDFLAQGYPALVRWSRDLDLLSDEEMQHLLNIHEDQPARTARVFEQAVLLREALYQIFVSTIARTPPPAESVAILDAAAQQALTHRRIVPNADGGVSWEWQTRQDADMMLWSITASALDLLFLEETDRLQQCPGCQWLFFDNSRNRSRTWCDMRFCGNRSKAKRFYQKQKSTT